jgi:broad specificity phosphatase PhoE
VLALSARYKDRVTTRILLVRHGQSEWNAAKRWQGWAESDLSDLGRQQAFEAAAAVGTVDAIVASDLQRALQTALIISESVGVGPVMTDADLRERDVGEWTGLTQDEIEERWPGDLDRWRRGELLSPPGGEQSDHIIERVERGLLRIGAELDGGEVLAVSHGGVMRLLERSSRGGNPPVFSNLGGLVVDVHGDRLDVGDRVLLLDPSTDHVTAPPNL